MLNYALNLLLRIFCPRRCLSRRRGTGLDYCDSSLRSSGVEVVVELRESGRLCGALQCAGLSNGIVDTLEGDAQQSPLVLGFVVCTLEKCGRQPDIRGA